MPVLKRNDIPALLAAVENGEAAPCYLIFGERFLCLDAANDLVGRLLPDERQRAGSLKTIDGDQEDLAQTLNLLRTYSLFGGRQIIRVTDSRLLHSKTVAKTLWDKAEKAHAARDLKRAGRFLGQMLGLADMSRADWQGEEGVAEFSAARWRALFGFAKPQNVSWAGEAATADPAAPRAAQPKGEVAELFLRAFEGGIPAGNTLILVAEAVDKRKKLYKYLAENGVILDLTVEGGGSAAARKNQEALLKDLVEKTLAGFRKKLGPRLLPLLFERTGFHPVAVVMETEKLALYTGDSATITKEDLDAIVGRTREEALFELTEAYAEGDLPETLRILGRLRESGMHPLAILAGLRNHLRKLLLVRAFQEQDQPVYAEGISYPAFQKSYLPRLKESRVEWPALLGGHPYVLYKMFRQAEQGSLAALRQALAELLRAEYRLKGSGVSESIVLENFLFRTMARGADFYAGAAR